MGDGSTLKLEVGPESHSYSNHGPRQLTTKNALDGLSILFLVSVLLDAGAGTHWSYKSKESGKVYSRSEGLAVASLEMFKAGAFSSDKDQPHQVDSAGLKNVTGADTSQRDASLRLESHVWIGGQSWTSHEAVLCFTESGTLRGQWQAGQYDW